MFLKIDTQGYEEEVLKGVDLKYISGIKIEIPLNPIYNNINFQFNDIINYLSDFKLISLHEVAVDNKTGLVYEMDGIFIKNDLLNEIT